MLIYEKNIIDITLEDLENLVDEDENKYIEFKSQLTPKDEKKHIPRAVCGFANAEGGILIYGFNEEKEGLEKIEGVELSDEWDKVKQRLVAILRDNLEPHADAEIEKIDLANGKVVILIKVPKSWTPPHRAKSNKKREFYIRRDGRTEPMEYMELRRMFDLHNSLIEKINEFRNKQVSKFSSEKTDKYKVIFHSIPLNAFSENRFSLEKLKSNIEKNKFIKGQFNYNFDGLYQGDFYYDIQLYRNGIFEAKFESYDARPIIIENFEKEFKMFCEDSLEIYKKLEIYCPIVLFITFTNINGWERHIDPLDRNVYIITDETRDCLNPNGEIITNATEIENAVYNIFVPIWNHYGVKRDYILQ